MLTRLLLRHHCRGFVSRSLSSGDAGVVTVLRSEKGDGVFTIRLDNQKKKQALSFALMKQLDDALRSAEFDDKCRAVLWIGGSGAVGDIFCSGLDLFDFAEQSGCLRSDLDATERARKCNQLGAIVQSLVGAFIDFPKPLIAGVNGLAIGIGATALGLCDAVLANNKKTTSFRTPFTSLGFVPEACSTVTFPLLMGPTVANDVLLFGRTLSAQEAFRAGLVSRLVDANRPEDFAEECHHFAAMAASLPPGSFAASKRLLRESKREALHTACRAEIAGISKQWQSREVSSAIANFMNRRKDKKK